jgi:ribonuclease P protein component
MSTPSPLAHPRAARLLRPGDFTALRRSGKRLSVRHFQCEYRPNTGDTARLGMAVSRRVSKLAVVRNRIRRQIRESFRLRRASLPACDVLVIARTSTTELPNAILRDELEQLWRKLISHASSESTRAAQTGTMRDPRSLSDFG